MSLLAQAAAPEINFWNGEHGSNLLWIKIIVTFLIGIGLMIGLLNAPSRIRRPIVSIAIFLSGLYWMLQWLWPKLKDGQEPTSAMEAASHWINDASPVVSSFSNILTAFILGLGVYSLSSIHFRRILKHQKDWIFSLFLLIAMTLMIFFGYWSWRTEEFGGVNVALTPHFENRAKDLLFDGMLQNLESAMFSVIAFYILSAAYRAFRIRSVESSILLGTALLVMLTLMGAIVVGWKGLIDGMTAGNSSNVLENFKLSEIGGWLTNNLQTPAIRGVEIGVGLGALAMGLRLWLSLERGGVNS